MKRSCLASLLLAVVLLLPACRQGTDQIVQPPAQPSAQQTPAAAPEQPKPAFTWQFDAPENRGMDPAALPALHADLDSINVLACAIVKGDAIVDTYYKEGYDETSNFLLHSCSKSITSALVGIAIAQGYIDGVDVPITTYFPQLSEADPRWQQVTIWHLLTHTSGVSSSDDVWEAWRASDNWVDFVLSRPIVAQPGTQFSYTTGGTHLLSAILQQATGKTAYQYGKEVLFDPLGMDSVQCGTDPQGISDGGNGFSMNLYDMAKFGRLFLHGGVWEGEQILPAQWVTDSTTVQFDRSTGSADYGYQWWVRTFGSRQYPAYFAQGHGGQYIFVVPDLELIVAIASDYTGSSSFYWQFVSDVVAACQPAA